MHWKTSFCIPRSLSLSLTNLTEGIVFPGSKQALSSASALMICCARTSHAGSAAAFKTLSEMMDFPTPVLAAFPWSLHARSGLEVIREENLLEGREGSILSFPTKYKRQTTNAKPLPQANAKPPNVEIESYEDDYPQTFLQTCSDPSCNRRRAFDWSELHHSRHHVYSSSFQ